jgi:hypothetical protein
MRALEFIAENSAGKIGDRRRMATRGLLKFRDIGGYDRIYELNRVMMAAATADGTDAPLTLDSESWVGRYNTAHPYTQEEHKMLKQAFKAAGTEYEDLNHGDLKSEELLAVNITSPVKAFKGYPR